jgi:DNA-binding NtrC family response regulator
LKLDLAGPRERPRLGFQAAAAGRIMAKTEKIHAHEQSRISPEKSEFSAAVSPMGHESSAPADPVIAVGARVTLEALEAEHLRCVLALARNLDDAAHILGIDPATLYRKRHRLGLL